MFGQLMANTGMTAEEIGEMTWDDAYDLYDYWDIHPPMSLLIEAQVGYRPAEKKKATKQSLKELAAEFGGG
jgi:hypothetical protein